MKERLRRRLAALGWGGPIEESCINIAWQYLLGSFDPKVVQRFVNDDGSAKTSECGHDSDPVWASVWAMLDESERVGRSGDLAPPSIKTPEQIATMLDRRFGQDKQEPRVRKTRRKGMSQVSVQKKC